MRTTVTLDQDVAAKLQQLARERGVSFKRALNETVRAGFEGEGRGARVYRMPSRQMGVRREWTSTAPGQLGGRALEDAEIVRKLQLRK